MSIQNSILKYYGSKWRLAPWIIDKMPAHAFYCEPFAGSAAVLLRKPHARYEILNDLSGDIVNFYRVMRDPAKARELARLVALTPYARDEFMLANEGLIDESVNEGLSDVERARRLLVRAYMSFGQSGAFSVVGFSLSISNNRAVGWGKIPEFIEPIYERLRGVAIENRDAGDLMRLVDSDDTLFYVDPPYMPETRGAYQGQYDVDMNNAEHEALLDTLAGLAGMVLLSGYDSELYNERLKGWRRYEINARTLNNDSIKREILWLNPAAARKQTRQLSLF